MCYYIHKYFRGIEKMNQILLQEIEMQPNLEKELRDIVNYRKVTDDGLIDNENETLIEKAKKVIKRLVK
jgi:hypothetical protein